MYIYTRVWIRVLVGDFVHEFADVHVGIRVILDEFDYFQYLYR